MLGSSSFRLYQVKYHEEDIQVQAIDHISLEKISGSITTISGPANDETWIDRRAHLEN
jgi:hypothetical protein